MTEEEMTITIRLVDYPQPGLYLALKDSNRLVLTRENIEKITTEYWKNSEKLPPEVKKSIEFQRCTFCPLKRKEDFCYALRPVLPLLGVVDNFVSHAK